MTLIRDTWRPEPTSEIPLFDSSSFRLFDELTQIADEHSPLVDNSIKAETGPWGKAHTPESLVHDIADTSRPLLSRAGDSIRLVVSIDEKLKQLSISHGIAENANLISFASKLIARQHQNSTALDGWQVRKASRETLGIVDRISEKVDEGGIKFSKFDFMLAQDEFQSGEAEFSEEVKRRKALDLRFADRVNWKGPSLFSINFPDGLNLLRHSSGALATIPLGEKATAIVLDRPDIDHRDMSSFSRHMWLFDQSAELLSDRDIPLMSASRTIRSAEYSPSFGSMNNPYGYARDQIITLGSVTDTLSLALTSDYTRANGYERFCAEMGNFTPRFTKTDAQKPGAWARTILSLFRR